MELWSYFTFFKYPDQNFLETSSTELYGKQVLRLPPQLLLGMVPVGISETTESGQALGESSGLLTNVSFSVLMYFWKQEGIPRTVVMTIWLLPLIPLTNSGECGGREGRRVVVLTCFEFKLPQASLLVFHILHSFCSFFHESTSQLFEVLSIFNSEVNH